MEFRSRKTMGTAVLVFGLCVAAAISAASAPSRSNASTGGTSPDGLKDMLPRIAEWKPVEEARLYDPASLFEYIDGAAEAYLTYDFRELAVGDYRLAASKATMTVEIYDMGSALNAFGIYSAERSPDSRFLPIGVEGYMEEGSLNFLAGRYYIKLMGYEGADKTEAHLKSYAAGILSKIKEPGGMPPVLKAFPAEGLVAHSEKYVALNFMGFKFLNRGFGAAYARDGREFEAFVIETKSADEAAAVLKRFVDQFAAAGGGATAGGSYRLKDPYLKNILVARVGSFLCGVSKIQDGGEAPGEKVLLALSLALGRK